MGTWITNRKSQAPDQSASLRSPWVQAFRSGTRRAHFIRRITVGMLVRTIWPAALSNSPCYKPTHVDRDVLLGGMPRPCQNVTPVVLTEGAGADRQNKTCEKYNLFSNTEVNVFTDWVTGHFINYSRPYSTHENRIIGLYVSQQYNLKMCEAPCGL